MSMKSIGTIVFLVGILRRLKDGEHLATDRIRRRVFLTVFPEKKNWKKNKSLKKNKNFKKKKMMKRKRRRGG